MYSWLITFLRLLDITTSSYLFSPTFREKEYELLFPLGLRPFRHRLGAENENLLRCIVREPTCFSGLLATLPMAAKAAVAGRPPYRRRRFHRNRPTRGQQARPSMRGKSVCRGDPGHAPFRVGINSIPKNRTRVWGNSAKVPSAKSFPPADLPKSSRPGVCLVAL